MIFVEGYKGDPLGAPLLKNGKCLFRVWAPFTDLVEVRILGDNWRLESTVRDERGDVAPGTLYSYRLDGGPDLPYPLSKSQPEGIHGPSQVATLDFPWKDVAWRTP